MKTFKIKNKGFTLIELLVVISIIGMLSSVVLGSLSSARQKAKNTKITAEVNQLKTAFELYRNDKGRYPNENVPDIKCPDCATTVISYLNSELVSNKYIPSISDYSTDGRMYYMTGEGWAGTYLFSDAGGDYYRATCGGKQLTKYLLAFYSDKPLNLPHTGYYYIDSLDNYDPYYWEYSADDWYCIGV